MFFLFFGAVSLGMGGFTTYFGVKKSRVIGILLLVLGVVVLFLLWWMVYQDETIDCEVAGGSLVSVLAAGLGGAIALAFVVMPMVFGSKEQIDEVESLAGTMVDAREVATPEIPEEPDQEDTAAQEEPVSEEKIELPEEEPKEEQ